MLQKYFKYTLLFNLVILVGCINTESGFSLDKLPNAEVGKPYSVVIGIWGGAMPSKKNIDWQIIPQDSGLDIRPVKEDWYDEIELYGIPKTQGDVSIHLKGFGYGSPSYHFDKVFILKVSPNHIPTGQNIKD